MEVEIKGLKLVCQGKQSFLTKLPLGGKEKKTWLGMPTSLTVGMFVWGNNSMKIVRLDS